MDGRMTESKKLKKCEVILMDLIVKKRIIDDEIPKTINNPYRKAYLSGSSDTLDEIINHIKTKII